MRAIFNLVKYESGRHLLSGGETRETAYIKINALAPTKTQQLPSSP